ncbi:hypothetical protein Droror1_Dr00010156 [Drosera rotundifolia]
MKMNDDALKVVIRPEAKYIAVALLDSTVKAYKKAWKKACTTSGTMARGRRHIEEQADVFLWMKKLGDEEILLLWMFCDQSASRNSHGNLIVVPSLRLNFEDGSFMLL